MQKLGFPGMKSLDQFRSLAGSASGAAKTYPFSSRPLQDSTSSGSFANLKLTAEKLVKEQATVKTDLELANSKLKKSMEHIRLLEEKLQNAFNENAKLKVKQKEDEKLWKGLESKFSSTRTLCDQLTETLQHLASQVQNAEKDKGHFEGKLSASSEAMDHLNQQMHDLSLKLVAAEENIRDRYKELEKLKIENEEKDKIHKDEQSRTADLIEEKDAMIRKFEEIVAENKLNIGSLTTEMAKLQLEFSLKEDEIKRLISIEDKLEEEKMNIQLSADELSNKLLWSHEETKKLESLVHLLATNLAELDNQSLNFMENFDKLNTVYDLCFKQLQKERDLDAGRAQKSYDQLHDKFLIATSENEALKSAGRELNDKILELQKGKESVLSELSEERCLTAQRIRTLESEAESLMSRKTEAELTVSTLKEEIGTLSENIRISESKMQELSLELSKLKVESGDKVEKMEADAQKKVEEIESIQKESENHQQRMSALENEVNQLQSLLQEKEMLIQEFKQAEKKMEEHITENKALLIAADTKLDEARKQYDLMLESKQLELSRHLKELSQRNDQAINDIRLRYEAEKREIVNVEKEKAEKAVEEMGRKLDKELADAKEEAKQQLLRVKDEHATQVLDIQQEHEQKKLSLQAKHDEEMRRVQIQAETELRERVTSLRSEHEVQLKAFKCQYEDECRNLQEELDLHRTKEERQRALLQLQWKVMSNKGQEEQEVNSKKEFSVSSIKRRDSRSAGGQRKQHSPARPENSVDDEQDSPYPKAAVTPVSKMLKKVEHVNTGSVISIQKHHKKVTHHEYEVETNNGRTITKRRKSTVMFEDPRKRKKRTTPKAKTPRSVSKGTAAVPRSANIGDLFSEGSLNPYADDPYAFD